MNDGENKYGVDEVIDYVADAYEFGEAVADAVSDGIQVAQDALFLFGQRAQITEFIEDWPTFRLQAGDIQGDEPTEIVDGVIARLNKDGQQMERGKARQIVIDAFRLGAASYENYQAGRNLIATIRS